MSEFTPKPWEVREVDGLFAIAHRDGWVLESNDEQQDRADANLIAAAPELYAALDALTLVVGLTPILGSKAALQEAVDIARATLKKARGE